MKNLKSIPLDLIEFANEWRKNYRDLIPSAGQPDNLFDVKNIEVPTSDSSRTIPSRLYIPTEKPENSLYPLILFVHGGGWVSGDLDTHDVLIRGLSLKFNAVVLSVGYRLLPEYEAIDQINDANDGLKWLFSNASKLNGDVQKIIGIGDSAGGGIIANLSHKLIRENSEIKLKAQWLMYPVVNFNFETPSMQKYGKVNFPTIDYLTFAERCYITEGLTNVDPNIVPFYADHKNIAPTLVSVAGADPLTSASEEYAKNVAQAGVKTELRNYPDSQHGFIQFYKNKAENPLGEKAFEEGAEIIKKWLKE